MRCSDFKGRTPFFLKQFQYFLVLLDREKKILPLIF